MNENLLHPVGFGLVLALAACGEPGTEPQLEGRPTPSAAALADVPNTWITRAEIPRIRGQFVGAPVTNSSGRSTVYIVDGVSGTLQAYDVATDTWSESFPAIPWQSRAYDLNGAAAINGKLYVSGGGWEFRGDRGCVSDLRRFDSATRKWSIISHMPATGSSGVSGVINGQLYILTGCDERDDYYGRRLTLAFYRYNPATNQWATLANPASRHVHGMAAVIGGKFYVAGGEDLSNLLEVYNPATNTWTRKARMPLGQFAATGRWDGAGVVLGGKLYVIGGAQLDIDGKYTEVRTNNVYDPASNTWSVKRPLPVGLSRLVGSRVVVNGQARIEVVSSRLGSTNFQYIP
jgi:N-acetylneuraminic acid mutarotase